jgi:hypothetical protein
MVDEQVILAAERLRDDVSDLRRQLRARYASPSQQVAAAEHRTRAAHLAETWLVELATDQGLSIAIGSAALADLNVHFQRILTFVEHATTRSRYEAEIRAILNNYTVNVLLPLKQSRGRRAQTPPPPASQGTVVHSAFVGQSFAPADKPVNQCVYETLDALGVKVVTGEKPKADFISEKVKSLIEGQSIFVGVFARRDKIARKREWTTSPWVIDEKAYALGRQKRLVLVKEQGVGSIGGIQGDYEYLEFTRDALESLAIRLVQLFDLTNNGLR